jgi:hypothetical protein
MTASNRTDAARRYSLLLSILLLAGCANLTVTHVTPGNQATVQGVRYYLPKPFLQVVPKADGTVSVTVIYLPNTSREYAVDTTSLASSYTFQIARDPLGLLSGVEYKADTTAVGQQLAASAQAAAVQSYNLNASQLATVQAQVNAAQSAVDAATSALAVAQAALSSDTANPSTTASQLATDNSNVQQAMARLQAAQDVLRRTQASSQNVANTISTATPVTTSGPTMGTALTAPNLTPPLYNLPSKFGAVLFAVNEDANGVSLTAVTSEIPGTGLGSKGELNEGVKDVAQRTFDTIGTALGAPLLQPAFQTAKLSDKQAVFTFSRAITGVSGFIVQTDATPPVPATIPSSPDGPLQDDHKTLKLDISKLSAGSTYVITMNYIWPVDSDRHHDLTATAQVKLTVTN